ncbi:hypothetical protein TNIN_214501 [Trichonephila inaurata madagascariensis]|uniref:Uncharacterized protein n=1 Tax=Trichonephila inaurata madagascariensis TaxID=2747483 RepID=A0A8X7C7D1_9ARAC|nr:hypothetical protein TNIN_214501 [Trichonephila inaurata madagascariensis]
MPNAPCTPSKPRKGTPTNTKNNYSSVVNSIVRPNVSYAQAANNNAPSNTSNSNNRQQMAPLAKGNPAIKTPTQASRAIAPPPQQVNKTPQPNWSTPKPYRAQPALSTLAQQINTLNFSETNTPQCNNKNQTKLKTRIIRPSSMQ